MQPRFQRRKEQLLAACQVPPTLFRGVMSRLEDFARPFAASLPSPESRTHSHTYLAGLLSDVERKNAESIAYRSDRDRQVIRRFIGEVDWDHEPLIDELNRQGAAALGSPGAVLVFDPSAFPKKGTASVGVQRQWCGRPGKLDNCQVGVFLGYVSDAEHALVDFRLYPPREWAQDRKRRKRAGVPKDVAYRTRHGLALEMLQRRGGTLPHAWIAGDDEMGRPAWFRRRSARDGERYLLAVPSNTTVRDREEAPPPYGGHGRRPKAPFRGVRAWCAALPAAAWTKLTARDGERGPLEVEIVARRVESKVDRRVVGFEETLVVVRFVVEGGPPGRRVRGDAGGRPVRGCRGAEARLLPLQRRSGHTSGGVRPSGEGGAPGRGGPEAIPERGRHGGVPGAELAGLAPPHGAVADRDVVPHSRGTPGEKRQRRH